MKCRAIIAVLSTVALSALAAEQGNPPKQGQMALSEDIIGAKVVDAKGSTIGEVKQLVIDPQSARIEYAILSVGGALSMTSNQAAVPWNQLQRGQDNKFTTSIPAENLKHAPSFEKDKWLRLSRQDWDKMVSVYVPGYQGAAPESATVSNQPGTSQGAQTASSSPQGQTGNYSAIEQREAQRRAAAQLPAIAEAPQEPEGAQSPVASASPSMSPTPSPTVSASPKGKK